MVTDQILGKPSMSRGQKLQRPRQALLFYHFQIQEMNGTLP
ncbi:unnamed protein product [Notodromas monacha]|uniref:Uncharacterized protein n=1 Tax=Notodromas monacha TaxID=399045 RepID=A0A7R9BV26_9CRUS|nr:unnamed protein product [Notodromas monacha]CAG0921174.1 unnamed protein product [Notodromas monacha]